MKQQENIEPYPCTPGIWYEVGRAGGLGQDECVYHVKLLEPFTPNICGRKADACIFHSDTRHPPFFRRGYFWWYSYQEWNRLAFEDAEMLEFRWRREHAQK